MAPRPPGKWSRGRLWEPRGLPASMAAPAPEPPWLPSTLRPNSSLPASSCAGTQLPAVAVGSGLHPFPGPPGLHPRGVGSCTSLRIHRTRPGNGVRKAYGSGGQSGWNGGAGQRPRDKVGAPGPLCPPPLPGKGPGLPLRFVSFQFWLSPATLGCGPLRRGRDASKVPLATLGGHQPRGRRWGTPPPVLRLFGKHSDVSKATAQSGASGQGRTPSLPAGSSEPPSPASWHTAGIRVPGVGWHGRGAPHRPLGTRSLALCVILALPLSV